MADGKKTLKFQMMMSPQEAELLDDWMFKNRLRSRAEAIRRLCQVGLALEAARPDIDDTIKELADGIDLFKSAYDSLEAEIGGSEALDTTFAATAMAITSVMRIAQAVDSLNSQADTLKLENDTDSVMKELEQLRNRLRKNHARQQGLIDESAQDKNRLRKRLKK